MSCTPRPEAAVEAHVRAASSTELERVAERVLTAGTLDEALGMPCTSGVPTMLLAGVVDLCLARVLLRRFRKGGYGADGILVAAAD